MTFQSRISLINGRDFFLSLFVDRFSYGAQWSTTLRFSFANHTNYKQTKELKMKKIAVLTMLSAMLALPGITGCGNDGQTVIEAPDETEDQTAMEGMSDEDYDAAMDASEND